MIFVAYLSALCTRPGHTATQYALLTALASVGRTIISAMSGYAGQFGEDAQLWYVTGLLHDIDFDQGNTPRFFRAHMQDGVITIPQWHSDEVKS